MLGFSLSKMNLLILVTALFVIFSFFVVTMSDLIVASSAKQELTKYMSKISLAANSDSMCYETTIYISSPIQYLTQSLYFQLLFKTEILSNQEKLIIGLTKKKRDNREIIATGSLAFDGEIHLYSWNPKKEPQIEEIQTESELEINPDKPFDLQLATADELLILKEVREGKKHLHIIPCSSSITNSCEANKLMVKKLISSEKLPCFDTGGN